jgi:hypothetical protein
MADNAIEFLDGWWDPTGNIVRYDEAKLHQPLPPEMRKRYAQAFGNSPELDKMTWEPQRMGKGGYLVADYHPWSTRFYSAAEVDETSNGLNGVRCVSALASP